MNAAELEERVRRLIVVVKDFPRPGIPFRDLTPILEQDPDAFGGLVDTMAEVLRRSNANAIAAIESWGYLFAAPLAAHLGLRLVLLRRAGRLPRATVREGYGMGYAADRALEMHTGVLSNEDSVMIIDDVLATGGTATAAANLVLQTGARVAGVTVAVEIASLQARARLTARGIQTHAAVRL